MHRTVTVVVGLLALSGIAAAAMHYVGTPYNTGFLDYPIVTALHVGLGGLYLTFAPFQFVPAIRNRWLGYHRWAGRSLVSIGLIVGFTGFFAATIFPFSGWAERVVVGDRSMHFLTPRSGLFHDTTMHTMRALPSTRVVSSVGRAPGF